MRRLEPSSLTVHLDAMYRAAWALCGSREDAEDLVQDTFAKVLKRPRLVQGDERAYLLQALRNTFASRLRSQGRRPQTVAMSDEWDPADLRAPAPDRVAESSEVLEAIAALPEDFRLAIVAVDIVGLSYGEAASLLGTREATITSRLHRARGRIASQFRDDPAAAGEGSAPARSLERKGPG